MTKDKVITNNRTFAITHSYKSFLSFMLGLTSTMPIVGIHLGTRDISLYRIIFVLVIFCWGINTLQKGFYLGVESKKYLLWLAEALLASICGFIFLSQSEAAWSSMAASYMAKVFSFIIFVVLWNSQENAKEFNSVVLKGFFCGCMLNCIWAIIDAGGFYLFGKSINNIVFAGYIARNGIRHNMLSLIIYPSGQIRAGGFNGDPAHLGFIAPIVAGYSVLKKKYWILLIAVGAILASASTTALVTSVITIILVIIRNYLNGNGNGKISTKILLRNMLLIFVLLAIVLVNGNRLYNVVESAFSRFADRIGEVYLNQSHTDIRWDYIRFVPLAVTHVLPFIFLGTGFGTASLGYVRDFEILSVLGNANNIPYDMENTYIAYLFDTGLIGFAIFIFILLGLFRFYIKKGDENEEINGIIWCSFCAMTFSMLFYHYILFAPQMLLLTIAASNIDIMRREK